MKKTSRAQIRAITFDLDDTLWDVWPTIARAEERLHDWLDQHHPEIPARYDTVGLREMSREVLQLQPQIAFDRTRVRKEALLLAASRAGSRDFCVDTAYEVFFAARNDVLFFAEVLPVLERLAAYYPLVALSNGNADIGRVGLDHLFSFAISAADVGEPKPHPVMFEVACQRLAMAPENVVHVGDDPDADILGALSAGLHTVWVNRAGKEWPLEQRAHAEVTCLEELERLLMQWQDQEINDNDK